MLSIYMECTLIVYLAGGLFFDGGGYKVLIGMAVVSAGWEFLNLGRGEVEARLRGFTGVVRKKG